MKQLSQIAETTSDEYINDYTIISSMPATIGSIMEVRNRLTELVGFSSSVEKLAEEHCKTRDAFMRAASATSFTYSPKDFREDNDITQRGIITHDNFTELNSTLTSMEVFCLAVWQHTGNNPVNSAKVCLIYR